MSIKILLADDHEIILEGLKALIESQDGMVVVGMASDGREAIALCRELSPDVAIMDISLPNLNGVEATRQIIDENPKIKVIALSVHGDRRFVARMLKAGATGYLLKNSAFGELVQAIRQVTAGNMYLSPKIAGEMVQDYLARGSGESVLTTRQKEVLQLIAEGKSTKEIADMLYISVKTVERHKAQIMEKLDIKNLADLIKYAFREGLTSID